MADAEHPRAAVAAAQPPGQHVERGAAVLHRRDRASRRPASCRPGPSRVRRGEVPMPSICPRAASCHSCSPGAAVDAELEARRAGVEHQRVVVHCARHPVSAPAAAACVRRQHRDGAARDARPRGCRRGWSGSPGTRAPSTRPGAVGVGQEAQLLRHHVARLEVGREQDVGIAGHLGVDALDLRRLAADGVVERQRPVEQRRP